MIIYLHHQRNINLQINILIIFIPTKTIHNGNINLYINPKNRDNNDKINHIKISLPNGLLYCNMDEYFILNVNSFNTCANWYNCTSKNNSCKVLVKDHDDEVVETFDIKLPVGNLNVLQITSMLFKNADLVLKDMFASTVLMKSRGTLSMIGQIGPSASARSKIEALSSLNILAQSFASRIGSLSCTSPDCTIHANSRQGPSASARMHLLEQAAAGVPDRKYPAAL
jgi:hypothetical protein